MILDDVNVGKKFSKEDIKQQKLASAMKKCNVHKHLRSLLVAIEKEKVSAVCSSLKRLNSSMASVNSTLSSASGEAFAFDGDILKKCLDTAIKDASLFMEGKVQVERVVQMLEEESGFGHVFYSAIAELPFTEKGKAIRHHKADGYTF